MNVQPGQKVQKYFSRNFIFRAVSCVLLIFVTSLQAGCIKKQELPKLVMEIKKVHDNQGQTHLDITNTVKKFIPEGTPIKHATEYLEKNKFDIIPTPEKGDNAILATFEEVKMQYYAKYNIYINTKNEKIKYLSAERILISRIAP